MDSRRRLNPLMDTVDFDTSQLLKKSALKEQSSVTLLKDKARPHSYVHGPVDFKPSSPATGAGSHHVHVVADVGRLYRPWRAT